MPRAGGRRRGSGSAATSRPATAGRRRARGRCRRSRAPARGRTTRVRRQARAQARGDAAQRATLRIRWRPAPRRRATRRRPGGRGTPRALGEPETCRRDARQTDLGVERSVGGRRGTAPSCEPVARVRAAPRPTSRRAETASMPAMPRQNVRRARRRVCGRRAGALRRRGGRASALGRQARPDAGRAGPRCGRTPRHVHRRDVTPPRARRTARRQDTTASCGVSRTVPRRALAGAAAPR